MSEKKIAIVAYVPVLHQGYVDFFDRNVTGTILGDGGREVFILGADFVGELMPLHTEIRGLNPAVVKVLISTLFLANVSVLTKDELTRLAGKRVILPQEEISRKFAEKYLADASPVFDKVFLRWDEASVFSQKVVTHDRTSDDAFDRSMMELAKGEAEKSSDWWRHVGAVAVSGKTVLFAEHNRHVPSEHMPYALGDPRDYIKAGQRSDLSTTLHGEWALIVRAAREGVSLKGAHIYVTTFPCPVCAKFIAFSGITKCFFGSGHASLDGETVMRSQGVEIVQVI
ncbi:MAG: hypothetical protein HY455_00875 [Parcubacteria group bacterium]|nr:hypothetical protein [Parcubacteria group bacterium]